MYTSFHGASVVIKVRHEHCRGKFSKTVSRVEGKDVSREGGREGWRDGAVNFINLCLNLWGEPRGGGGRRAVSAGFGVHNGPRDTMRLDRAGEISATRTHVSGTRVLFVAWLRKDRSPPPL